VSSVEAAAIVGQWTDPGSDLTNTLAATLDIDYTVAFANAWRSGAWQWTTKMRVAFANDRSTEELNAISRQENLAKSDSGPQQMATTRPLSMVRLVDRILLHQDLRFVATA
jgi:hypothetical protein